MEESGARIPLTTTIDYGLKAQMDEAGFNFSTALAIGCRELLEKKRIGSTSEERAERLAKMLRQAAAGLPAGQSLADIVAAGKNKGVV